MRSLGLSSRFPGNSAAIALTLVIFGTCHPVQAKVIIFDPPGSTYTLPAAINASGWVTGSWVDSNRNNH